MRYSSTICLLLTVFASSIFATPSQVIIIPNAEVNSLGNLTPQGFERAGALPSYIITTPNFSSYGPPSTVFASRPYSQIPTQAAIQTIAPTAEVLALPIHSGFSPQQNTVLADLILDGSNYNDKNILICWPPGSIQALAAALGVVSPPSFPDNVHNITWVITFSPVSLKIYPQDVLVTDTTTNCGCGTIPYASNTGYITPEPIIDSPSVWSFVSEPDLHPMKITVNTMQSGLAPGFVFVAPYAFSDDAIYGQPGSLVMDNEGNPIWFRPLSSPNLMNTDFRVQTLNGNPVLTFWQGTLATPPVYTNAPGGSSEPGSCYYIIDSAYNVIKTVSAQNGYTSDIHEFLLTPSNTALFLSTKTVPKNLTSYGGPQDGFVQDFAIQEVDLNTNELLFFWNALDHIPLTDSYAPASSSTSSGNVWDAYHLNSVGLTDVGNEIIVSGRNTWTIYRINKTTGNIVWHLGGKQNDFTFGPGAEFSWQHDARFIAPNKVSLFDDNCCQSATVPPGTPPSHGLILQLNTITYTANVDKTYFHNPLITVSSQGNVQSLGNGNKFVGWGQSKYFSEFAAAGNTMSTPATNLLYDAQMPGDNYTYRAYRDVWVGNPSYPPSLAVQKSSGQNNVYASWNGSTETATWQVFAGTDPTSLSLVGSAPKSGFETVISVTDNGPYFQVKALDGSNVVLGVSSVVQLK